MAALKSSWTLASPNLETIETNSQGVGSGVYCCVTALSSGGCTPLQGASANPQTHRALPICVLTSLFCPLLPSRCLPGVQSASKMHVSKVPIVRLLSVCNCFPVPTHSRRDLVGVWGWGNVPSRPPVLRHLHLSI